MKWIFLPILVRGNHWVLLVADVPKMEVSIMDSLSGNNDIYIDMWRKYMAVRSRKTQELQGFWGNGSLCSALQEDGNSCGPFVLLNALALTRTINPRQLTQRHAVAMRKFVYHKLKQHSSDFQL